MLIFSQTYPLSTTCQFTQFSVIRVFKMSNLTSSTAHHPSFEETYTYSGGLDGRIWLDFERKSGTTVADVYDFILPTNDENYRSCKAR